MFSSKRQRENEKVNRRLLDIVDDCVAGTEGVDTYFYHVVSTIALMVDQHRGDTHISEGDIGISITSDEISVVDIEEGECLLQLKMFRPKSLQKIRTLLEAYKLTNYTVLNDDEIYEVDDLLDELE